MKIIVSIAIACPVENVFAFVSDYTRDPAWRAGVIGMSQTPTGRSRVGTHTLEVARFFGRTMTTLAEVTKYEPGRAIVFAGVMAKKIRVSGSRTVEEANGQARFTYQANVEGLDCLTKIFRHLPHTLSSLPFFRWPYNPFLSAFITSDLAANGELGERQKDAQCEAEEVTLSLQIVSRAENGLLVVPEQREMCAPLLPMEASYIVHGYVEYFPTVTSLSRLDLEESVFRSLVIRSLRSGSVSGCGTVGSASADTV